jgi:hypothetical protein
MRSHSHLELYSYLVCALLVLSVWFWLLTRACENYLFPYIDALLGENDQEADLVPDPIEMIDWSGFDIRSKAA